MFSEIFYLNICKHVYARSRLQCKVSLFDAGARVRDVAATPTPSRFGAPEPLVPLVDGRAGGPEASQRPLPPPTPQARQARQLFKSVFFSGFSFEMIYARIAKKSAPEKVLSSGRSSAGARPSSSARRIYDLLKEVSTFLLLSICSVTFL